MRTPHQNAAYLWVFLHTALFRFLPSVSTIIFRLWVPHSFRLSTALGFRLFAVSFARLDDCLQGVPLGLHANVAVVAEHLLRDVPGDVHDGLVARTALG